MSTPSKIISDKRKRDARELALLIYDMFKESDMNGNVSDDKMHNKT